MLSNVLRYPHMSTSLSLSPAQSRVPCCTFIAREPRRTCGMSGVRGVSVSSPHLSFLAH